MKTSPLPANLSTIIDAACRNETPLSADAEAWVRMAVHAMFTGTRVPSHPMNGTCPRSTVEKQQIKAMKVFTAVQARLAQSEVVRRAADTVRTVTDAFAGLGEGFFLGGLPCGHDGREVKRHRVFVKAPAAQFEQPDAAELARVQEEHAQMCAVLDDTDFTTTAGPVLALRHVLVAMDGHFATSQIQMEIIDALTVRVHELEGQVLKYAADSKDWQHKADAAEVVLATVKGMAQACKWDEKQPLHMWVKDIAFSRASAEELAARKGQEQSTVHELLCSYGWDGGQTVALKDWLETALGRAKANQATIDELLAAIPRVNERGSRDIVTWLKGLFDDMGEKCGTLAEITEWAVSCGWGSPTGGRLIKWLKKNHANYGELVLLADSAGRSARVHAVEAWLENIAMSVAGVVPEGNRGATFTDGGLWPLGWGTGKPGELSRWSYGANGPVPEAYTAKMKALEE